MFIKSSGIWIWILSMGFAGCWQKPEFSVPEPKEVDGLNLASFAQIELTSELTLNQKNRVKLRFERNDEKKYPVSIQKIEFLSEKTKIDFLKMNEKNDLFCEEVSIEKECILEVLLEPKVYGKIEEILRIQIQEGDLLRDLEVPLIYRSGESAYKEIHFLPLKNYYFDDLSKITKVLQLPNHQIILGGEYYADEFKKNLGVFLMSFHQNNENLEKDMNFGQDGQIRFDIVTEDFGSEKVKDLKKIGDQKFEIDVKIESHGIEWSDFFYLNGQQQEVEQRNTLNEDEVLSNEFDVKTNEKLLAEFEFEKSFFTVHQDENSLIFTEWEKNRTKIGFERLRNETNDIDLETLWCVERAGTYWIGYSKKNSLESFVFHYEKPDGVLAPTLKPYPINPFLNSESAGVIRWIQGAPVEGSNKFVIFGVVEADKNKKLILSEFESDGKWLQNQFLREPQNRKIQKIHRAFFQNSRWLILGEDSKEEDFLIITH